MRRDKRQTWRWEAPPGWPPAPWGWSPPPGWAPPPEWGHAPEGWQFWVSGRRPFTFGWGWLVTHAVLVGLLMLPYYLTWEDMDPSDGKAIGVGGIATPILPLGLPWSIPAMVDMDPTWLAYRAEPAPSLYFLGPAVLNVVLHLAYRVHRRRREERLANAPTMSMPAPHL